MIRNLLTIVAAVAGLLTLLPVLLLALPVILFSTLVRAIADRLEPRSVGWEELIQYEPEIGWRPVANQDVVVGDLNGDGFRVSTGPDGWRGTTDLASADLVVFGDSFAFGFGIDDGDFLTEIAGVEIKAIGAPGYNLVQAYLWMRRNAAHLKGKQVVVLAYPANDLDDNLIPSMERYRMPFLRQTGDGSWEIVTSHVKESPWPSVSPRENDTRYVEICSDTRRTERALSALDYLLELFSHTTSEAGATCTLATVPCLANVSRRAIDRELAGSPLAQTFDEAALDLRIGRLCEKSGIGFLPLVQHLDSDDYLTRDVHWNARGNRKVADILTRMAS